MATLRTNPRRQIQNSVEYVRSFRHVDPAAFNNSLSEFENICDPSWSTDQKYEKLQDHIKECVEIHAPLRKLSKREKKFRLKPWISRGLKTSIEIKNRMYEKICKYNQIQLKPRYNRYKKKDRKINMGCPT